MTSTPRLRLLTVGHGRATEQELVCLLRGAGVEQLVDVRRFPGSRAHPHLSRDALSLSLPSAGIGYRWEERLGGRRRLLQGEPSPDSWWTVPAFRAYAAHTRTAEFRDGLDAVLEQAVASRVAVMCSESVWWRCHRRLVADVAVLARGAQVEHLMPTGALVAHRRAAGARVVGGEVVWDRTDEEQITSHDSPM